MWLYEHQVDEYDDKVVLDVLVGEALASRALCEADAFAECAVVCFAVGGVQRFDWGAAFDADGHRVLDVSAQCAAFGVTSQEINDRRSTTPGKAEQFTFAGLHLIPNCEGVLGTSRCGRHAGVV